MTIGTIRLQLRSFSPEHLLALIEGEDEFHRSFGLRAAVGLRAYFTSGEVSPVWLAQLREAKATDPWTHGFAVIERASSQVIGSAGFKGPPDAEGMVEISYAIVPTFQGKGYATEAARELTSFACGDPRVRLIRAHTLPTNNASTRVLTKNGLGWVGEVVDPEDGLVWRWERPKSRSMDQGAPMIRVVLPFHLQTLAQINGEVMLDIEGPVTQRSVLDALEARYPMLRGTIRDHDTLKRRPFIRFFACKEDLSLEPPEKPLPDEVINGTEPFLIVGAMAGG